MYGIIGYPLSHSFSPPMQNSAFQERVINSVYLPIEVEPNNLKTVVTALPYMNFIGFNITIPYKIEIIKHLDKVDELAKCIGAVNTVVIKDGKMKGYNTDGKGYLRSLEEGLGESVEDKKIFVLGSGGAARAICMTLAINKVSAIYICNRTHEKAIILSEAINKNAAKLSYTVPMEDREIEKIIKTCDILINTTSIGTYPKDDEIPIDKSLLNKDLFVSDVIYNPGKTRLLQEAEKLGCKNYQGWECCYIKAPRLLNYGQELKRLQK